MTITSGDMDQRVTIECKVAVPDGAGGTRTYWEVAQGGEVWAAVRAMAARESMDEGRINATYMVAFTIYSFPGLNEASHRIVWDGSPFNIRGILKSGNPLTVQVQAERGVAS